MLPAAQGHADTDSPLAVYLTFDTDVVYTIGSDVKINILVYSEGDFHDPVEVSFVVNSASVTNVRRAVGRYEANFQITQAMLDGGRVVSCTAFVNEGPYPAPWTADTVYVPVKSLDMEIVVLDSHDRFMSPGDECEFEVRTSYDGRAVDPDDGTLWVYRQLQDNTYQGTIEMSRLSTGVFAGKLVTPAFNRTSVWHIGCEAEYTTRDGVVYGFNRDVVEVEMFPVWIKRASISTTASTLEFHVWEKDGWPGVDSVEGYPLANAQVQLDYRYRDETLAYQEKTAQGSTGAAGYVSLDLDHDDMRTGDVAIEVNGMVTVGSGMSGHRQAFDFLLPVRDYPHIPDMQGFDVQLHNYYIPEWRPLTTLGHTARFDGQPLVGAEIFVYIAEDDWIYHSGSVLTGPQGYFNVQIKTPPLPEGERYLVIDKCDYQVQIGGNWYLDSNWLYFGEANLYGEFNSTHDRDVSLSVKNLKEYGMAQVSIDHPEADGRDETALVMWGLGDPWDYWWNQQWLYDLLWAPVRPHWSVWPSNYQHVNYVPAYYRDGAWHATFFLPGFIPDNWDVWVHGEILFTDTNVRRSATLRELDPEPGRGWPGVAIATPPVMGVLEGTINVTGTATDADGLERVDVRIDGGDWMECAGLEDWFLEVDTLDLAHGVHLVEARAWNGDHFSKVVGRSFFTDQRPRVVVENPEDGGHYHGDLAMNGTAWDDLSVDAVQVNIDDGTWTDADGTASWEYLVDLGALESGEHTLSVRAMAGAQESDHQRLTFWVDRPPEIVITDPPADAELSGTVHVKGEAQDDLSLLEIHLSIDGGEWFPADEDAEWSYALDTTELSYGEHHVEAKAWDGHEWSDTAYVAFTVDNPPVITSVSLADGEVVSGIHRVDGESKDDNHGVDHVAQAQVGGSTQWDEVPLEENGDFAYDLDTTGLDPGQHTVTFRIYDGKVHSSAWSVSFIVDEPPVLGEMSIGTGDTLGGTVTITGGSSDDTGVEGVQVRVDGGEWVDVPVDGDGDWSYDLDTTGLPHGSHTLEVRVGDGVQWSEPTSVDFNVDQMPTVTVTSPEEGAKYKKDFDFTGEATDDDEVVRVEVRVDGGEWMTAEGITSWSIALKVKDLKKGQHTGEVRAYDGIQYSEVVSITFEVQKEQDDSPGFSSVLVAVALLSALAAVVARRR